MSWNTIDSDPAVFNELVQTLGVRNVQIDEILTLDELYSMAPVYGVIFLFKYYAKNYQNFADTDKYVEDNSVFFSQQIVQNACATQAVLNVLLNMDDVVEIGDELKNFKDFTKDLPPEFKGESLRNSDLIRMTHNSFTPPNPFFDDSEEPKEVDAKNDDLFHFVGYIIKNNKIYELDGLRQHAIKHCDLAESDEPISKLIEVIQKRIASFGEAEHRFSLQVITNDKLQQAIENNDEYAIERETKKRQTWKRENILRKMDMLGLNFTMLKEITSALSDEEWEQAKKNFKKPSNY